MWVWKGHLLPSASLPPLPAKFLTPPCMLTLYPFSVLPL